MRLTLLPDPAGARLTTVDVRLVDRVLITGSYLPVHYTTTVGLT